MVTHLAGGVSMFVVTPPCPGSRGGIPNLHGLRYRKLPDSLARRSKDGIAHCGRDGRNSWFSNTAQSFMSIDRRHCNPPSESLQQYENKESQSIPRCGYFWGFSCESIQHSPILSPSANGWSSSSVCLQGVFNEPIHSVGVHPPPMSISGQASLPVWAQYRRNGCPGRQ